MALDLQRRRDDLSLPLSPSLRQFIMLRSFEELQKSVMHASVARVARCLDLDLEQRRSARSELLQLPSRTPTVSRSRAAAACHPDSIRSIAQPVWLRRKPKGGWFGWCWMDVFRARRHLVNRCTTQPTQAQPSLPPNGRTTVSLMAVNGHPSSQNTASSEWWSTCSASRSFPPAPSSRNRSRISVGKW
jgi:hypothetical protein